MSLAEMLFEEGVPPKVSITEGVEIAKQFSTSDSSRFINGILDAIYNNLLKEKEIFINRKALAHMAVNDPDGFSVIIKSLS